MIAKAESISHTSNSVGYAREKNKAELLDKNLVLGDEPGEIKKEFERFQTLNTRCEKNTLSFVISPSKQDGLKMNNDDLKKLTKEFLSRIEPEPKKIKQKGKTIRKEKVNMNLSNHQYVSYIHHDNGQKHLHVYVNRIDEQGKAFPDTFISNKSSHIAEEIAIERKMTIAKEIQIAKQLEISKKYENVFEAHKDVLSQKPKNLNEYTLKMKKRGIEPLFKHSKTNKIVGMQFKIGDEIIKGSAIDKTMSGANIHKAVLQIAKSLVRNIGMSM